MHWAQIQALEGDPCPPAVKRPPVSKCWRSIIKRDQADAELAERHRLGWLALFRKGLSVTKRA